MQIYWQGQDITEYVSIAGCVHRECSRGGNDLLDLTMRNAATWFSWGPETDDAIRITHKGYDTGTLYLHTLIPDGDGFRVLATSTKSGAQRQAWGSYRGYSFLELMNRIAGESGMTGYLYGTEGKWTYPYLERENEGPGAFLDRVGGWENICVKAVGGSFRGIYLPWAQQRDATAEITVKAGQEGARYTRREREKWGKVTVRGIGFESWAADAEETARPEKVITTLPAADRATAGRWARGILTAHNRDCESLDIDMVLNARFMAMERVDVVGNTAANGEWIVDTAEHDLKEEKSRIRMVRCIKSIR